MGWPFYPLGAQVQACDLLRDIILRAGGLSAPGWSDVKREAGCCLQDLSHGWHVNVGDAVKFTQVQNVWSRMTSPGFRGTSDDATYCLGEINHGGGGRTPPPPPNPMPCSEPPPRRKRRKPRRGPRKGPKKS